VRLEAFRGEKVVWFIDLETTQHHDTPVLTISQTDVIGLGLPLNRQDGRITISMTEGTFCSNEEVPALLSGNDFKKIICGKSATYIGSDGLSVAGCSLIVRAAEDGSTPGGRVRGVDEERLSHRRTVAAVIVETTSSGIVMAEEGYHYHGWNGELNGVNVYFSGKAPSTEQIEGIATRGGKCFNKNEPTKSDPMSLLVVKEGSEWRETRKGKIALDLKYNIPIAYIAELDDVLRSE